jgi:transcriptional regulator with XRE-family HTH domain
MKVNEIKVALAKKGINQEEAAKQLGISRQQLSYYINGRSIPTIHMAQKFYTILGIPYSKQVKFFEKEE